MNKLLDFDIYTVTLIGYLQLEHGDTIQGLIDKRSDLMLLVDREKILSYNPIFSKSIVDSPNFVRMIRSALERIIMSRSELDEDRSVLIDELRVATSAHSRPLNIKLGKLSHEHIGKLVSFRGMVLQQSIPKPTITNAVYECPKCGERTSIVCPSLYIEVPDACSVCQLRNPKFKLLDSECERTNTQRIVIQEPYEDSIRSSGLVRVDALVPDGLLNSFEEGVNNVFEGVIRMKKINKLTNVQDWYVEISNITPDKDSLENLSLSDKDIKELNTVASDSDRLNKLISYIVPKIVGLDDLKKAILLQMVGGVSRDDYINNRKRGEINLLFVGNPGTGKSELIKSVRNIVPRVQMASGGDTTRVGLTASISQMDLMGSKEVVLTPGALVLAHKGILLIDEFDKMRPEDHDSLHTAMSDSEVTIHKYNQHQTFKTEVSVLAAANPQYNSFRNGKSLNELPFKSSLLSRFDLVFLIDGSILEGNLERIHKSMLDYNVNRFESDNIDINFIRKYVAYAKRFKPILTAEMEDIYARESYNLLKSVKDSEACIKNGLNLRFNNTIYRLAEASAKLRFSNEINIEDIRLAKSLIINAYKSANIDLGSPELDLELISSGMNTENKKKVEFIMELFRDSLSISYDELLKFSNLSDDELRPIINKLLHTGYINEYSPKHYKLKE